MKITGLVDFCLEIVRNCHLALESVVSTKNGVNSEESLSDTSDNEDENTGGSGVDKESFKSKVERSINKVIFLIKI